VDPRSTERRQLSRCRWSAKLRPLGSLFHCNYKTASSPGDGNAWTLAVKKGRDAK